MGSTVARGAYSQGKYWLLTIPHHLFTPFLPKGVQFIQGQLERGSETAYLHWQVAVAFEKKVRLGGVKSVFGEGIHCELSRSDAVNQYVEKDETAIPNTRFKLGVCPYKRNCSEDWDRIYENAKRGAFDDIPSDVVIRYYGNLRRIANDSAVLVERESVRCVCYYGPSGVGKSFRARNEAIGKIYTKDPTSRWWDGYSGESTVIVDEYSGGFPMSSLLRWTDKYPCRVEVKGGSVPLHATLIIFTCNMHPDEWYPDCLPHHKAAIRRRIEFVECPIKMF